MNLLFTILLTLNLSSNIDSVVEIDAQDDIVQLSNVSEIGIDSAYKKQNSSRKLPTGLYYSIALFTACSSLFVYNKLFR